MISKYKHWEDRCNLVRRNGAVVPVVRLQVKSKNTVEPANNPEFVSSSIAYFKQIAVIALSSCILCIPAKCSALALSMMPPIQHEAMSTTPHQIDPSLFTEDAWAGMHKLQAYARYVDDVRGSGAEDVEGATSNRELVEKVWQTVSQNYYDPQGSFSQASWAEQLLHTLRAHGGILHTRQEAYAAAAELVASLGDRYSQFLAPSQFRQALRKPLPAEQKYLAAQFVGVGVQLGEAQPGGGRVVDAPLAGSTAEAAGMMRGDVVLTIDGWPADELSLAQVSALLRGPAGSTTPLVWRHPDGPLLYMYLERNPLPQPPVKASRIALATGQQVQYARLHYVSRQTTQMLRGVLEAGEKEGVAGYVIDVRNNPGGVFEEAVSMACMFLQHDEVVVKTVQDGAADQWVAGHLSPRSFDPSIVALQGPLTEKPVVVITNRSSASAAEVLAGALQDNHHAVIVGEQTYGKGLIQYFYPMPDGSGVKLTVAKYLSPHEHDITLQGGLRPDFSCSDHPTGFPDQTSRLDSCITNSVELLSHPWS